MNTIDVAFMPLQNITNPLHSNKALVKKNKNFCFWASQQCTNFFHVAVRNWGGKTCQERKRRQNSSCSLCLTNSVLICSPIQLTEVSWSKNKPKNPLTKGSGKETSPCSCTLLRGGTAQADAKGASRGARWGLGLHRAQGTDLLGMAELRAVCSALPSSSNTGPLCLKPCYSYREWKGRWSQSVPSNSKKTRTQTVELLRQHGRCHLLQKLKRGKTACYTLCFGRESTFKAQLIPGKDTELSYTM